MNAPPQPGPEAAAAAAAAANTAAPGNTAEQSPAAAPTRRWFGWRQVLAGLMILGCGIVIGAAGTIAIARRAILRFHQPQHAPQRITARLTRTLDLSPEQVEAVGAVVQHRLDNLAAVRAETHGRIADEFAVAREEIDALLDDHQRDAWRRQCEKLERLIPILRRPDETPSPSPEPARP